MAEQIDAHVTICHDLDDIQVHALNGRLGMSAVRMRIGGVSCWGDPALGIYLEVDDAPGTLEALRRVLAVDDPPGTRFAPHVTLTHPRTTPPEVAEAAWAELSTWNLDVEVEINSVDIIEHDGARWKTTERTSLLGR